MPPSEICGVMRSVMPTSRRSMVLKTLPRLVSLVDVEAMNGTFWPTTISASWLSVVRMFGADRMLTSLFTSAALNERDLGRDDRPVRQPDRLVARRRGDQAAESAGRVAAEESGGQIVEAGAAEEDAVADAGRALQLDAERARACRGAPP